MSVIFNVLSVLACLLSILAVIFAAQSATREQELRDVLARFPASRLKSLETSLADTQGALEEVANRVKMMKVRSAANHSEPRGSFPDPYKDPDGWRKAMNLRLSAAKLGGSKLE